MVTYFFFILCLQFKITDRHYGMNYSEIFRYLSRKYGCVVLGIYRHLEESDCLPKSLLPFLNDKEDEIIEEEQNAEKSEEINKYVCYSHRKVIDYKLLEIKRLSHV